MHNTPDITNLYLIFAAVSAGIIFAFWVSDRIEERKAPKPQPAPTPKPAPFRFEFSFNDEAIDHIVHELYIMHSIHPLTWASADDLDLRNDLEFGLQSKGVKVALSDRDYRNIMSFWVAHKHLDLDDLADHLTTYISTHSH